MGVQPKIIEFAQAAWEARTADDLRMMRDVTERDLRIYQKLIEAGEFELLKVTFKGDFIGWVIWSIDQEPDGFSLVINAATALPVQGQDIAGIIFEIFLDAGRKIGARSVRAWTTRPGMRRKMEKRGAVTRFEMEYEI